jgi:hypothetical protein
MVIRNKILLLLVLAFCCCFTNCDRACAPVLVNETASPIAVSVSWANAGEEIIAIPPQREFFQRRKGMSIVSMSVRLESGKIETFTARELESLRRKAPTTFEVWIFTENGIRLGDQTDLSKLREARRNRN